MSTLSTANEPPIEPPLYTEYPCGAVLPIGDPAAGAPYWDAVPLDRVLVPVSYQQQMTPGPHPLDVLAGLAIEAVDETGSVVQGQVTDVQSPPSGQRLLTWTPEVPLQPGQYTGRVVGGEFPEHPASIECGPGYNSGGIVYPESSFQFTVEDAWQEWVNGAELTLSFGGTGSTVPSGCCKVAAGQCPINEDCFQCWDTWLQPTGHAEWSGPGIAYLSVGLVRSGDTPSDPGNGRLAATLSRTSDGGFREAFSVTSYGDYCFEGTVAASGVEPQTIEACGVFSEEDHAEQFAGDPSPREECRTRVPVTTCESLPDGLTELATLYVVRRATEGEASAALAAAPYHTLEGCLTTDSPSEPASGDAGLDGGSSTPELTADGGEDAEVPEAPDSGIQVSDPVAPSETDASLAPASTIDAGSEAIATDAGPDAPDPPPPQVREPPSEDCSCRTWNERGSRSWWALLAAIGGLTLRRRRPSHPSERRTAS